MSVEGNQTAKESSATDRERILTSEVVVRWRDIWNVCGRNLALEIARGGSVKILPRGEVKGSARIHRWNPLTDHPVLKARPPSAQGLVKTINRKI
jgi:hypothetical protein